MPELEVINIEPSMRVDDVVSRYRSTLRVFARHRIDACCGGHATLGEAASEKGMAVDALLTELRAEAGRNVGGRETQ